MLDDGLVIIRCPPPGPWQWRRNGSPSDRGVSRGYSAAVGGRTPLASSGRVQQLIVASTANRPARNHDAEQTGRLVRRSVLPGSAYSIIAGDEIRSANIACVKTV